MKIAPPEFGEPLEPAHPCEQGRRLLALRRSSSADRMTGPGPDAETLEALLTIAARVPDHRRVYPFRFIIFEGDARLRAGEILAERFAATTPDATAEKIEAERNRFARAPVVIAVVARIDRAHRTPEWEQMLTNGAVCFNLLLAASAFGFAANWLTEWCAYDEEVLRGLGLKPDEKISGFVYIGRATDQPRERQRPVMSDMISHF
jgi:nitroreductase